MARPGSPQALARPSAKAVRRALLAAVLAACPVAAPAGPPPPPRPEPPGAICGRADLRGIALPPIHGEGGCGIAAPVRLAAAAGVALEPPATMGCTTARALGDWLAKAAKPAFVARGGDLEAVTVLDSYSCRGRNRVPGAKLSEHGVGRAIDIGAFRLDGGGTVTVSDDWTGSPFSTTLRRLHDAACGTFATVLGPEANALHADHFHLDMETRPSGRPYCE